MAARPTDPPVPDDTVAVSIEATPKRAFASVVERPGWARSGRTEALALTALGLAGPRYAVVAEEAGESVPLGTFEVVERVTGSSGTDYGVPSAVTPMSRRPVSAAEADRLARLVAAAWVILDRVAETAPLELRKGPRGGGRDRDRIIAHLVEADWTYAREIGIRQPQPDPADLPAVDALRSAMLDVLRRPSDGSPLADRRWPPRYAASRIVWHALDHAWEMEDRRDPA